MKSIYLVLFLSMSLLACKKSANEKETMKKEQSPQVTEVASIKGEQLTGVTISNQRLFVNFPYWRKPIKFSVAEIKEGNQFTPYPNAQWNNWEIGQPVTDSTFVCVQSVVASNNLLYVVDTRNPLFQGVIGQPIVFVFDLNTNELVRTYKLPEKAFHKDSYINDIRIDNERGYAYCTDSANSGLVIINLKTGEAKRVLDEHPSTNSEQAYLTFEGKKWNNTVHSDGIALDTKRGMLYYHALTGYNLYAISVEKLIKASEKEIENSVQLVAKTSAPDGMIIHKNILYYADLEHHKIMQLDLKTKEISTVVEGDNVKWADTFSIENNYLYYTNSRIHEAGGDISDLVFTVNRIKL
ncbi:major royal jelly protein family protein [Tenacibaculum holothuriorum]|uniref:Major royal jelly protein family protein n=1 Tax=Tenacibaculum holothuriorum TaxID=1635173 RepID=A0A1Y2PCY5_9FLAO|nr:L-dopachrome tautomerase-related protein [Tenacibaculum holothuriorum]OSY88295.1 major royal jelly protein family protein [Tenacibaculum holothuriorum]